MSRISKRIRYLKKKFRQGKLRRRGKKVRTERELMHMALSRRRFAKR